MTNREEKKKQLARILKSMSSSDDRLERAITALEEAAGDNEEQEALERNPKPKSVQELVAMYQTKQLGMKEKGNAAGSSGITKNPPKKQKAKTNMYSLNFCRYRKAGLTYRRTTGNVQISGFTDDNTYQEVVAQGARGLTVKADPADLHLIVSGGLVMDDTLQDGKPWTLGGYVQEIGGVSARCKKTFGIYIPLDVEEEESSVDEKKGNSGKRKADESAETPETKRTCSSDLSSSAPGLGTAYNPICIGDSSPAIVHLDEMMIAKYCPVRDGVVRTCVVVTGREGISRLQNFDLDSSDSEVKEKVLSDFPPMQPENQSEFVLVELSLGTTTYLKAVFPENHSVKLTNMKFKVKGKLVHSETLVQLLSSTTALLCISPFHGKVPYTWEKNVFSAWEKMDLPPHTCLIFVGGRGTYRCSVGDDTVTFKVIEPKASKSTNMCHKEKTLMVKFEEVKIGEVIGRGTFGTVNRGKWKGKDVALKRMKTAGYVNTVEDVSNYKEISVLRQLEHPNIVSLFGYTMAEDEVILIMNFVDGSNLDRMLFGKKEYREFMAEQVAFITTKIAEAIQYMHHHNPVVIHQDIKPQNVLITRDLKGVFVCDMGVTELKQAAQVTMTSSSKGPGTYPYMAPEMFKKGKRGRAVDIYSLGCLYLEVFSRRRVWPGLDSTEIMMKVCGSYDSPPCMPDLSDINGVHLEICGSCLQLNQTSRPKIDEVVEMLRKLPDSTC